MHSSVLPFPIRKRSFWHVFEQSTDRLNLPRQLSFSAQIFRFASDGEFKEFIPFFSPQLALVDSNLNWIDPLALVRVLNRRYRAPVLMFFDSKRHKHRDHFIRQAYKAGVLELIDSESTEGDLIESIDFALQVSTKAFSH